MVGERGEEAAAAAMEEEISSGCWEVLYRLETGNAYVVYGDTWADGLLFDWRGRKQGIRNGLWS